MSTYKYKAIDLAGKVYTSKLELDSEERVINYLKEKQLSPIFIKKVDTSSINLKLFNPKITDKDLSMFCKQFSLIIDAGIPEILAFSIISPQIENITLKEIMTNVYKDIQKGSSISESMKKYKQLPQLMISTIEAGENSGKLNLSLKQLAQQYDRNLESSRKIKSAMTYPLITIIIMSLATILITSFVIPNYINMFEQMDAKLPQITLIFIKVNNLITHKWYIPIILLGVIFMLKPFFKTHILKSVKDNILIKLPLIGKIIIQINTMLFCQNISILLSSGVSIISSLKIVSKLVTNSKFQSSLKTITYEVEKGLSLSEAINNSKVFPITLKNIIKIGEEAGFEAEIDILYKTSKLYQDDINVKIDNLIKLIEPILTIIIAIVIGLLMLAVIMPTFSLAIQLS